jgi:beta-glucanase (GH16 family)
MRLISFLPILILVSCAPKNNALLRGKNKPLTNDGWKLVWNDEFNYNGLPDSTKWNYNVGGNGWGNNELEYYTNADTNNAVVRGGKLFIKILKETKGKNNFTSARLVTKGKGDWLYGKIEVMAKLPEGRGMWPAIWMFPTDQEYGGWPKSGEIDIMENVGYNPDSIYTTIHTKSFNHVIGTQKSEGTFQNDSYAAFHLYGIEWDKEKINFFIDDKLVFSFKNTGNGFAEWPFDKRFFLIINTAVGGGWGGKKGVDESIFPANMEIDYVRVFQKLK